jgi:hypothetical protein
MRGKLNATFDRLTKIVHLTVFDGYVNALSAKFACVFLIRWLISYFYSANSTKLVCIKITSEE